MLRNKNISKQQGASCLQYALGWKLNGFAFSFIDGCVCNHVMRLDLTFKSIFHEALNLC